MTVGDSLKGGGTPVPLNGAVSRRQLNDSITVYGERINIAASADYFQRVDYFEAQIGSGVKVSEIKEIHTWMNRDDFDSEGEEAWIKKAESLGIPIVFGEE
jgi:hypothetical protein